jgi:hypothetical protein
MHGKLEKNVDENLLLQLVVDFFGAYLFWEGFLKIINIS